MVEPTHSERFLALLDQHYPAWCEARAELNELPLAAEACAELASAGQCPDAVYDGRVLFIEFVNIPFQPPR